MRKLLFSAASAVAFVCASGLMVASGATAQTAMPAPTLTSAQQTDYNSWTIEQRSSYDSWPGAYQTYFWTLTPAQMTGWWRLSAEQRAQIVAMTPEQQAATWTSVEAQLTGQPAPSVVQANPVGSSDMPAATPPNPPMADSPVPPAQPADPSYQAGPYKGALTPPPPQAMNKVYPVCTRKLQDSCRNPGGK